MNAFANRIHQPKISIRRLPTARWLLLGLFLFAPLSIRAETFAEYRADIKTSNLLIQNLLYPDSEDESADDFAELERDSLKKIRALLPAAKKSNGEAQTWRRTIAG